MLREYNDSPEAVLYDNKIIMVLSRANALDNLSFDQQKLLDNANRIWDLEEEISGLDDSESIHKKNVHNHLMTEYMATDYYMAATNYGTYYNYQTALSAMVDPDGLNSWGPWHEIGHHHQQQSYLWTGLIEVTVNIYSLYVEKKMGVTPSRLKQDNIWPKVRSYVNQSYDSKDYDQISDLFVKLAMFAQLSQAYGDDFFIQLHRQTREDKPTGTTNQLKKKYFMLKACAISGHDLTDFFRDWGLKDVSTAYSDIAKLDLPKPSVNPSSLEE